MNNIRYKQVDFNPFDQLNQVPTTEPQREILANIFLGGLPANCSYNESVSLYLKGTFDLIAYQKALTILIQRHQALRTVFSNDGLLQFFNDATDVKVEFVDLSAYNENTKKAEVAEITGCEAETPFDVHSGPLYRFIVIRHNQDFHQLILSFHHIVCDGWSLGIIMQDLSKIYSCIISNTPFSAPNALRFSDYVQEEIIYSQSEQAAQTEHYWIELYKDKPTSFEFPSDKPRPAIRTFSAKRVDVPVDEKLVEKLRKKATSLGVSYVTMLTGAFEVFLHRISGHHDIILALPAAGQPATNHHHLIGHCVNVLPLRSEIDPFSSFYDYINKRKSTLLDAYDHQHFTFGSLIRKLNLPRDPSRIPLVPVAFNLDLGITDGVYFEGCTFEFATNPRHYENFELFLNAAGKGNTLVLECTFNTDLFDMELMKLRMEEFAVLLGSIADDHLKPLSQLALLGSGELDFIFNRYNNIDADFSTPFTINHWFEITASKYPDAVAITSGNERMTYSELNAKANQLANWIRSENIEPGSFVGILAERNCALIVSMLGILKSRCVYVPVDPVYPPERIQYILKDSDCRLLLFSEKYTDHVSGFSLRKLNLDNDWNKYVAVKSSDNPGLEASTNELAYVIYTSGSTGKPKGTLIEHRNVTRLFTATGHWYNFDQNDVWTMFHSAAFDFSVWEIWGALLYGGRLVIVPYDVSREPSKFYDLLISERVTVLNQTPSAFKTLIFEDVIRQKNDSCVKTLRYIIFGGEALELESLRPWFSNHGDASPQLVNMYGITETTVHVTYRPVSLADLDNGKGSMIGVPIPDLQIYLLDNNLQPVPLGLPGEMFVGGAGVGRGYLNRPELSAARFLFNDFNPFSGTPLYRSGDLARLLPDGDLEYLGRIDNQVKIRGFRIELGEIEALLARHPDIKQHVVIAREDTQGDKRLTAYLVMDNTDIPVNDIRDYLRKELPDYMIPAAFVFMDKIPVTSNGKTDRKALPKPEMEVATDRKFEEPATPLEEMLAHIWCDILGLYRVGRNDNFFELGGHSILGVAMFNAIEKKLGVKKSLPLLFTAPTIAELARVINNEGHSQPISCLVPLHEKGSKPPLFCIHMHNGNVNRWRVLVKHLPDDQPIYAVQPLGLDSNKEPHKTIEEMAAHYINVIKEVQPHGPYHLIGLCFSGMVVFEMTARLEALGDKVAYLGMINNYAPPENPTLYRIKTGLNKFMKMELGEKFSYAMEKNLEVGKKLLFHSGKSKKSEISQNGSGLDNEQVPETGNDLRNIHSLALLNYHPTHRIHTNLYIYRTDDPIEKHFNEHLGWDRLVKGGIYTTIVPGSDNDTIITDEPFNVLLSKSIGDHLHNL